MGDLDNKQDKKVKRSIFTRETIGVITALFSTLCCVCLLTGESVFSLPGLFVAKFLYGVFGILAYAVVVYAFIIGVQLITGKNFGFSKKRKALVIIAISLMAIVGQIISMGNVSTDFGGYLSNSYIRGASFASATFSGVIGSLIAYPISALLTAVGGSVVLGILFAVVVYFLVVDFVKEHAKKQVEDMQTFKTSYAGEQDQNVEVSGVKDYPFEISPQSNLKPTQKLFVNDADSFALKSKKELDKEDATQLKVEFTAGELGIGKATSPYSEAFAQDMQKKIEYIKTPSQVNIDKINANNPYSTKLNQAYGYNTSAEQENTVQVSHPISRQDTSSTKIPFIEHSQESQDDTQIRAQDFTSRYASFETDRSFQRQEPQESFRSLENQDSDVQQENQFDFNKEQIPHIQEEQEQPLVSLGRSSLIDNERSRRILFGNEEQQASKAMGEEEQAKQEFDQQLDEPDIEFEQTDIEIEQSDIELDKEEQTAKERSFTRGFGSTPPSTSIVRNIFEDKQKPQRVEEQPLQQEVQEQPQKEQPPINRPFYRPPLDLLESYARPVDAPVENHELRKEIIRQTLEEFKINAEMSGHVQGPSITRYEIKMPAGISVKKVLPYDDDLKMRLESKDGVRIEAPIPGKNLVGIEVANKYKITVGLREVLEGASGKPEKKGSLMFAIGKDIVGNAITDNLAEGPHFLVAGSTGSGKSVCLNLMIVSMIMRYSPEELRLILIDPKGVEFRPYEHLPHLMIDEIITGPKKALAVLKWAYDEMERRYKVFQEHFGVVKIDDYNAQIASDTVAKMPRIVIIVDELSNLMETCKRDMEARILAIAQKARAAGIHLVLATQRPSVDVITGTIKANLPSRIALRVMNYADSNTILSEGGAEKLLGNGDMLYKNSSMSECERYQGAYISTREVNNIVSYIKEKNAAYFDDELAEFLENETNPKEEPVGNSYDDNGNMSAGEQEMLEACLWLAIKSKSISISQLQRRFRMGYARAGSFVDQMEKLGYIGPSEGGNRPRRVIITREEMEEKYGPEKDLFNE